ncbi:hypothetical protein LPA49_03490 [Pseudoalteromonas sp. MB41]|uniref:hypothetical protein n=1 Tax=unclassified Pseudoalteromonas TaxID=194690 RepID=UPI0015D5346B|nr:MULTISPECIES: hypothetical protein [unclassified Pseudoalteromonas]MCC9659618.1 hypothetical protein [Pseudoalteromonas sp. MB41]QLJ07559.1 hypothetical protein GZH31_12290 [Pseudoalteromonas sp. JSTW]
MAEKFRVMFAGLESGIDQTQATEQLAAKLKTSTDKVAGLFEHKPLFAPSDQEKALKQAKLLASVGIKAKLQPVSQQPASIGLDAKQRDERIFDALDYITSSLIRLEEKLDDLEQRLPELENSSELSSTDKWQEEDLLDEEAYCEPVKKRSNTLLYSLIAMVVVLLIALGIVELFPDLFSFLES